MSDLDALIADHIETALVLLEMDDDPITRFRAATRLAAVVKRGTAEVRKEAVTQLRGRGLSLSDISADLGLSRQRIEQISHGR